MNVLFVCTGNICRSPMAEAIAKEMAGDLDMAFGSAGLYAMDGACASPNAVEAAMAFGADVRDHRARQLDPEVAGWADRI
ncbi:low molecular weight protein arginine phosphatase, partial [bacterium]|nr:low molecular weight protein arginine phosphatase [bacterium]